MMKAQKVIRLILSFVVVFGVVFNWTPAFVVSAEGKNNPPVAVDSSITINEDQVPGITLQATDADGDTLTFMVGTPQHGVLSGTEPDLTYTPAGDYFGPDAFTFTAFDGQDTSNIATVSITVLPVNDAPIFTKGADQVVAENAPAQTVANWATGIKTGPANEASQVVDFLIESDNAPLFSAAPAVAPNGTLTYTLAADKHGKANVTVRLHDDGGVENGGVDTSVPQTFTITVTYDNVAPVADTQKLTTEEDVALIVPVTGSDANNDALTFAIKDMPTNGVAAIHGSQLTYLPNANFFGPDSLTFTASDGLLTSQPATISFTITSVNDPPTFQAAADSIVRMEDSAAYNAPWASGMSAGPSNESDQTLTFVITNDNPTLFFAGPSVDLVTGSLSFTPAPNANGTANLTVVLKDDGGGDDTSTPAALAITFVAVNDPPVAVNDTASTTMDTPVTINVLNNDTDVDGDTLDVTLVSNPVFGTVQINTDKTITYTPNSGWIGKDTFDYTITDGSRTAKAKVTVQVAAPEVIWHHLYLPAMITGH